MFRILEISYGNHEIEGFSMSKDAQWFSLRHIDCYAAGRNSRRTQFRGKEPFTA